MKEMHLLKVLFISQTMLLPHSLFMFNLQPGLPLKSSSPFLSLASPQMSRGLSFPRGGVPGTPTPVSPQISTDADHDLV